MRNRRSAAFSPPTSPGRAVSRPALRVEGPGPSVAYRAERLHGLVSSLGATEELHSENSRRFWREIGDAELLAEPRGRVVWRVSLAPTEAASYTAEIGRALDAAW